MREIMNVKRSQMTWTKKSRESKSHIRLNLKKKKRDWS